MGRFLNKKALFAALILIVAGEFVMQKPLEHLGRALLARDSVVMKQLLSQYPFPVLISPDGTRVLMKSRREDDFLISVSRLEDGRDEISSSSDETQLALAWSPDGAQIGYLESLPNGSGFSLCIWELASHSLRRFPDIVSQNAMFPIRWAPDSKRILMYGSNSGAGGALLLISDLNAETPRVNHIGLIAKNGDYSWSPDGTLLAYVSGDVPGTIIIKRFSGEAALEKNILISSNAVIRDISWSYDQNKILASVREVNDQFFTLVVVDLESGAVTSLIEQDFDIRRPVWLTDNNRFVFERVREGINSLMLSSLESRGELRQLTTEVGSQRIINSSANRKNIYYARIPPHEPFSIGAIDVDSLNVKADVVNRPPAVIKKSPLTPELRSIRSSDGHDIPLIVWRPPAPNPQEEARGLLIVHGGPHIQELPDWDSRIQLAVDRGYVVTAVNYRGSSGYGAKYERVENTAGQAEDLISTARFLEGEFKISPRNLTVIASSFGTLLTLEALKHASNFFAHGILLSFFSPQGFSCPPADFTGSIDLFHGERDPIAPVANTRRFYRECLQGSEKNSLTEFEKENHHFHRTRSWASVYERIFSLPR